MQNLTFAVVVGWKNDLADNSELHNSTCRLYATASQLLEFPLVLVNKLMIGLSPAPPRSCHRQTRLQAGGERGQEEDHAVRAGPAHGPVQRRPPAEHAGRLRRQAHVQGHLPEEQVDRKGRRQTDRQTDGRMSEWTAFQDGGKMFVVFPFAENQKL